MAEQKSLPVASGLTAPARKKLVFAYDSKSRRIAKTVYASDAGTSTWMLTKDVRFVHDGWQMIAELDHTSATGTGLVGSEVDRTFLWGPDLSGSMTGAGGVGGLLSSTYQGITYEVCSDANGNVTGLVPVSGTGVGTLVARFDDDPLGNRVTHVGPSVELCPFGFSSKYLDTETGVVSYELKGYLPGVGLWMSRDPIEEEGGVNMVAVNSNDLVNTWDFLGLFDAQQHYASRTDEIRSYLTNSERNHFAQMFGLYGAAGKILSVPIRCAVVDSKMRTDAAAAYNKNTNEIVFPSTGAAADFVWHEQVHAWNYQNGFAEDHSIDEGMAYLMQGYYNMLDGLGKKIWPYGYGDY